MRILYCEDDMDIAEAIRITLTQLGHSVDHVQTADQAIQLFDAAQSKPYDLIITDVEMPGHLGLYFASHARSKGYEGRIVVLTAHDKETFEPSLTAVDGEYWQKTKFIEQLGEMIYKNDDEKTESTTQID